MAWPFCDFLLGKNVDNRRWDREKIVSSFYHTRVWNLLSAHFLQTRFTFLLFFLNSQKLCESNSLLNFSHIHDLSFLSSSIKEKFWQKFKKRHQLYMCPSGYYDLIDFKSLCNHKFQFDNHTYSWVFFF